MKERHQHVRAIERDTFYIRNPISCPSEDVLFAREKNGTKLGGVEMNQEKVQQLKEGAVMSFQKEREELALSFRTEKERESERREREIKAFFASLTLYP